MNREELLQKIKDEVAERYYYPGWYAVIKYPMDADARSKMFDEIANRYAIAMCDYQKKECAEKLDIADAHFTNDDGYEWLASNIVSETKNVAE